MAQIIWTEPALIDLNDIAEYIALDKPGAARNLVKDVFKSVKRLKRFPKSGKRPPELRDTSYQEIIVGPSRVLYREEKNKVYILYVMRGERELRKFLLHRQKESSYHEYQQDQ